MTKNASRHQAEEDMRLVRLLPLSMGGNDEAFKHISRILDEERGEVTVTSDDYYDREGLEALRSLQFARIGHSMVTD